MSIRNHSRHASRSVAAPRRTLSRAATLVAAGFTVVAGPGLPPMAATAQPPASPTPFVTPDTDGCPNRTWPPPPIDASEVPEPGRKAPVALPVPDPPIGGERMGECGVVLPPGAPALPEGISATGWMVSDLDTGQVLAAKDPHGRYRPASTIKVLLAGVALRALDPDTVVTGTQEDANADGTRVGIGPGGKYTNMQLFHALIMASGNDAAHAIAAQLGGDDATVAKMNALAVRLQALDTRAATPSGLDGPGMSTSPYDLSVLFRDAMTIPLFAELIHTREYQFPGYPANPKIPGDVDHPSFPIANDNHLLFVYDGALGGKTGYTDDARQTFVFAAQRNGHRLAVTLLKADVLPIRPWQQAARLLDYAFALPSGSSVGTLAGEPATPWNPSVALASPPGRSPGESHAAEATDHSDLRFALMACGVALVAVLLFFAWRLLRRPR